MYKKVSIFILLFFIANLFAQIKNIHHELEVKLDPAGRNIKVINEITFSADKIKSELNFLLHGDLEVQSISKGIKLILNQNEPEAKDFGVSEEKFKKPKNIPFNFYTIDIPPATTGELKIVLKYDGKIHHPVQQLAEEYARGFSETPGIIDEKGIYLAGSTYWIPWFGDDLFTFNINVSLPEDWDVVSQGKRTRHEKKNGLRLIRWESPQLMEEVYLIGAQFSEYSKNVGAVTAMAFLRTPDENLANKYLETTAQYLEMYRKLVGLFPFSKFALVENFWETGYGMPSFTLLGEKVIRMPWILHSSYPHELLHNWWGNGVYVDYDSGNWCEGLTAYMADHLVAEQRGQGADYRRSTLQRFTDYVNAENDFPLTQFKSRTDAPTEAVGYGKSLMLWNMLRQKVGDEKFVSGFQSFYRDNKFKRATFDDIRVSFEKVTGGNLKPFFNQWVTRKGAPQLQLTDVKIKKAGAKYELDFSLKQIQSGDVFDLDIPAVVYFSDEVKSESLQMNKKQQSYHFTYSKHPLKIDIDPEFQLFRKLHYNEIPPALSKIFGAEKILIVLPENESETKKAAYKKLAENWSTDKSKDIKTAQDSEFEKIPADRAIWIFGKNNKFKNLVNEGIKDNNAEIMENAVRFANTTLEENNNSFIISARHPDDPNTVIVWLSTDVEAAVNGLARKLPHYGKYSYLAFEGDEPSNIAKGQWQAVHSPISKIIPIASGATPEIQDLSLPKREALAKLEPVFSTDELLNHVKYLASDALQGRGLGSAGIDIAAQYIAEQFKLAGLQPGSDEKTYFQSWIQRTGSENKELTLKNVIGIIPGTKEEWNDQSVIVCAHYDHLGLGWPDARKGNEGKFHYGADDNASGVAIMIELAKLLGKNMQPERTIVFVAFTGEESGLQGSKYYIKNMKRFPANKIIGALNLDTVGRLGENKLLVINSSSAREWRFIFMGSSYVTGVESEMVSQDLDASDQVSFIAAGIPAVQFFSGANRDYHSPSDTPDKIDAAGMVKVATFVREAIVYLAEREEPLTFQGEVSSAAKPTHPGAEAGARQVSTGTMPDFTFSGEGVKIADAPPDSPVAKAGLQKGDVIIKFGGESVKNLRDYSNELKKYKPGDEVKLVFMRDKNEYTTSIKLIER